MLHVLYFNFHMNELLTMFHTSLRILFFFLYEHMIYLFRFAFLFCLELIMLYMASVSKCKMEARIISRVTRKPTMWFPNRSHTNRVKQVEKHARSLKFKKQRNRTIRVLKTKACTDQLICSFVFTYAKC